jgi:hypothetical protein
MTILDDEGERFSCREGALQEAAVVASELRGDSDFAGCYVVLTDERRQEIAQLPI